MRILVIGSGGREHALVWKIARSAQVEAVFAAPGSDGMAELARCVPEVKDDDEDALLELIGRERIDLVVIGPEAPLAAGLADRLRATGVAVFGPSAQAAQLESSKAWAKQFMARHAIPTAGFLMHVVNSCCSGVRSHELRCCWRRRMATRRCVFAPVHFFASWISSTGALRSTTLASAFREPGN